VDGGGGNSTRDAGLVGVGSGELLLLLLLVSASSSGCDFDV
jgi:hypothetical protein